MKGCIAGNGPAGDAQEPFPGLAQRGVVLPGRPLEVGLFDPGDDPVVRSHAGTGPEPGQEDVHGEVRDAGQTEEGAGDRVIRRDQVPMVIPEGIRTGLEDGGGLEQQILSESGSQEDFHQAG